MPDIETILPDMPTLRKTRPRRSLVLTLIALAGLLTWIVLRPEMQPDAEAIPPSVHAELRKAGFKSTSGVSAVSFKSTRVTEHAEEALKMTQQVRALDQVLTEKRTQRRAKFYFEESIGLYAGPVMAVRYSRSVLPIIGFILPRQFWASSVLSSFVAQQVDSGFPREVGSTLLARTTFEDRYAGGKLALREAIRLRCAVVNVVDASSVDRRLPGVAARIECEEVPEPGGREAFSKEPRTIVFEHSRYSHLYVVDLGWSIPVEGERTFTIDATPFKETWENALESFEGHS